MQELLTKAYSHIYNLNPYPKIRAELLYNMFYKTFDVVHADTDELKEAAHRLRYQVFCIENTGYEDPARHPDGQEHDEYDKFSTQALLIYKPTNQPIGTARTIFADPDNPEKSFPLQTICSAARLHDERYIKASCEISRLCISRAAKRKILEEITRNKNNLGINPAIIKLALAIAPIGLVRGCFEMALRKDILNCYGIMEPFHLNNLVKAGLKYEKLAENIDYHGERTPFVMNIIETLEYAISERRDVWNIVTNKGIMHNTASALAKKIHEEPLHHQKPQ